MKNILIACISLFSEDRLKNRDGSPKPPIAYTSGDITVKAFQTNEACIKHLIKELSQQGGIHDYIRVLTNSVADKDGFTLPYLDKSISEFCSDERISAPNVHDIRLGEDEATHRYDRALAEISNHIQSIAKDDDQINIYLDMAGGKRDNYVFIQLLTKLLSYYGYSVHAYYVDWLGENRGTVVNSDETFRQMMILDAVHEFVIHGSSAALRDYFRRSHNIVVSNLLRSMDKFSNAVQLCSTNLSETIKQLTEDLEIADKNITQQDGEFYVIKAMIPLIRQKFHLSDSSDISTLGIIRWCLENGLVQQALTIYNENIADILFSNGIVNFNMQHYATAKFNMMCEKNQFAPKYTNELLYALDEVFEHILKTQNNQPTKVKKFLSKYRKSKTHKKDIERTIAATFFSDGFIPDCITVNIDTELFHKLLMDTRYAKIRRNVINHASATNMYPQALTDLLTLDIYPYSATQPQSTTPKNIIKDMLRAVDNIEYAIEQLRK